MDNAIENWNVSGNGRETLGRLGLFGHGI
jgi:hypothetical protein